MEPKQETDREDIFVSKKYMCQPVYLKAGPVLAGVMLIVIIVGTALYNAGVISGSSNEMYWVIICISAITGIAAVGFFLYSLQFVSFSEEKIYIVSYTCFGIPVRSEYRIDKINEVIIFYGKDTTIDFYHIGKNVLNVQIRDEVLETVLKYIPHDVISVDLQQCPQKVKGKQQQLITLLLSDKQKKDLHSKGLFWCDG